MFGGGRTRVQHKDGDVGWLHSSKGDLLEAKGINRMDYRAFNRLEGIVIVQVYGKKYYLDVERCVKHMVKLMQENGWNWEF